MAATRSDDLVGALRDERAHLREKHDAGLGGVALARELAGATDRAVTAIWARATGGDDTGLALVALGGFARGELAPHSDIDLMVLHGGSSRASVVSEAVFYPLWDAGLTVGHAVRTVKECVRLAKENLEAETSFLRPRLVAGDASLYEGFVSATKAATIKRRDRFARDVHAMMLARHRTGGSATSQLEPNIKDGAGGLRDLHVLGWLETVFGPLDDLIEARARAKLEDAAELLQRVRNHLHFTSERATDIVSFQSQRPAALFLGYTDGARTAEDAFMRDLFAATRSVELIVSSVVVELCARTTKRAREPRRPGAFVVEDGRVVVVEEPDLRTEPERAFELFSLGAPPGAAALRWLTRALAEVQTMEWTPEVRRAFARLLREGDPHALELADDAGVFAHLLPEWDEVRCQPQRNVYHAFTVDAHLFNTVAALRALATDGMPLARDVLADVDELDGLLLACLLHDVGKGGDEDHSVRGERLALAICDRIGIGEPRRSTIAWLVRNHLLLVDAATRRDLNDENFIVDIATRIGDAKRARMLYLLSVADGHATGPAAWTPWKAGLVTELFTKVLGVIERGGLVDRESLELARMRTLELRRGVSRFPVAQVDAHVEGMSRAYILAFPPEALIRHFALMAAPLADGEVRVHSAPTDERGVYEVTFIARDRPGLFATISGVLALHGVNILTAQGFTRADGIAIEVFRCVGSLESDIDAPRWARIEQDAAKALRGRISVSARLAEKRAAYRDRPSMGKAEPPKVIVDNAGSDFLTIVEVHAPDAIGLLYDITSGLAELALDIQVAKVATYGDDVVDVFYVRDLDGQKVADPEQLAEIERSLLHRLASRR